MTVELKSNEMVIKKWRLEEVKDQIKEIKGTDYTKFSKSQRERDFFELESLINQLDLDLSDLLAKSSKPIKDFN